jgi:hypothetical protein
LEKPQSSPGHRLASDVYGLRADRTPVMDGIPKARKGQRASRRVATLLPGALERWRAAPAEGVHSDEFCHVAMCPKFENAKILASAAVFVLIPHLAAPFCCNSKRLCETPREQVCPLESLIASKKTKA